MSYRDDQLAREADFVEDDTFTRERYRLFARELPKGFDGEVLDVGCGLGIGGAAFRTSRPHAILDGNELVPARIQRIPQDVYRSVLPGLLQDLPEKNQYDVILAGEVVEHIPLTHFDEFLDAVLAHLRPGGLFLLTTPNPHYVLLRRRTSHGSVLGGAHVSVHCRATLSQYLEAHGFRVEKVTGSGKMTRIFGRRAPGPLYGAFLLRAVAA